MKHSQRPRHSMSEPRSGSDRVKRAQDSTKVHLPSVPNLYSCRVLVKRPLSAIPDGPGRYRSSVLTLSRMLRSRLTPINETFAAAATLNVGTEERSDRVTRAQDSTKVHLPSVANLYSCRVLVKTHR